ncbi:MAG: hypothetical protein DI544_02560 [Sphingomonas taxi]|uniref:Major facilitator superfamily (MFS) profile domain-containing protein n=1 Tax=Sphingomonas taxi TaxID=1549858 RepID=A0A2W5PJW7_9SPHN|nr:MAG: hypothetical protein DI544_02560 [Sphingomonas taxi]
MTEPAAAPARYRWAILAIAWFALLLSAADRSLWAITAPVAARDLGLSPVLALGAFVTATQSGYLVALLFGSIAADWFGPRRMLTVALCWLGLAMFAFGRSTSLPHGLVAQFGVGMGAAPVFAIGMKLIVNWFAPDRRAGAISLFMTALPTPTILVNLVAPIGIGLLGWRGNYTLVAGITLAAGVLFAIFVGDGPAARTAPAQRPSSLKPLWDSRAFRCIVIANMAGPCASWGFMTWANLILVERHALSIAQSGVIVASYGAGAFAGLLLSGPVCDRLGLDRRRATMGCFIAFALGLLVTGSLDELAAVRVAVPLLGVLAYAYAPLLNTMLAHAAGALAASAAGLATMLTFAAEGVQPLVSGGIYTHTHSFQAVCAALAAGPVVAAIAIARAPAQ